ncbi:hypothetical protein MRB53_042337 [Persea americana]|nr:hypothetical protein MRB53_042337 [Persea americana]
MLHSTGPTASQPVFMQHNGRHTSTGSVSNANLIQPGVYGDQRYPVVSTQAQNHAITQTLAQSSMHDQQSLAHESQRLSQLERTECMQQQNIARSSGLQVQIMREQLFDVLPQSTQLTAVFNDISHHYRAIDKFYNNIQQHHRVLSKHHLTAQHMLQNHAQIPAPRLDSSLHSYQSPNNNAYMHNQHHVMAQQHHTSEREHDRRSLQNLERSQSMDMASNNQNLVRLSRESFQSLQRSNAGVVQPTAAHQTQFNANGMAYSMPSQQKGPDKSGHPMYGSSQAATMPPPMPSIQQPAVTQNTSMANTHNRTMSHSNCRLPVSVSTGGNIGMAILEERQREMLPKPSVGRSLAEQRRRASNKIDEDDMPLAALRRDQAAHTTPATQQQTKVNPKTTSTEAMQQLASEQAKDLLGAFSPREVPSMPVTMVQATDQTHPQTAAHTSGIDKNVAAPKMGFRSLPQTSPHPFGTSRGSQPVHGSSSWQRVPPLPATMTQPDSVPYMAFTAINSGNRAVSTPVITAAQAIPAHQASTAEIRRDDAAAQVQDIGEWVIIDKD